MLELAGELNEQQKSYIKMIVQGVDNMAKLVNNLLDLGRIDFGVGLQVESIPVLDIIERVTSSLQLQVTQKNISFGVEIPKDLPHAIEADQALLHQALYNLVENALKYTPEGGNVTIHLHCTESSLTFAIQDSGIGIPKSDLPRLFEKFYRGTNREALEVDRRTSRRARLGGKRIGTGKHLPPAGSACTAKAVTGEISDT
jgi:signal transduction histidine kinase